jgi:soluble cytochrome b562
MGWGVGITTKRQSALRAAFLWQFGWKLGERVLNSMGLYYNGMAVYNTDVLNLQALGRFPMVQYTLAQSPDVILSVPGKDSPKARNKAMEQLMELMDDDKLTTELSNGFSPNEFIEVKEPEPTPSDDEDAISQAVQVLSNLATLKMKVQSSREEAMAVRTQIDKLFSDEAVSEEELTDLKQGFKVLKTFAQSNLRYREARAQAEEARAVLDRALKGD